MPNDISIETSIPAEVNEALARLASERGQSKPALIREAVLAFVAQQEAFAAAVAEGRDAARSGQLIDHDEVARQIAVLLSAKQ
jgi:predicted transcriptional regulator